MEKPCPLLDALEGRGPAAYTGAPLSFLLVEVSGGRLCLTGALPLSDNGDCYTRTGAEYRYELERGEAEKLLSALCRGGGRPERILADTFEFSRPDYPLKDYLDSLQISYQYQQWEGESI